MTIPPNGPTPRQLEALYGILDSRDWPSIKTLTVSQASDIIRAHSLRWRRYPASDKQKRLLITKNRWREGMTSGEAHELIAHTVEEEKRMTKEELNAYYDQIAYARSYPVWQVEAEAPQEGSAKAMQDAGCQAADPQVTITK